MYLSEIMKLIILNSGLGSRLKNLTKNNPKSLVQLDENQTIFSRAISILSKFNFNEVIITTGYLNNVLEDYAKKMFPNLNFRFVHNPVYDKTNYIKSLDYIDSEFEEDIVLLHGDLVFSENVANKIINAKKTSVVIDSSIDIPKDDFKAKIDNNLVKYIGVDYFGNSAVACQPFYKLLAEDWKIWKNKIHEYCEKGNVDVYAENALNELTNEIQLNPLDIHGDLCSEVDTVEDLNNVKGIL